LYDANKSANNNEQHVGAGGWGGGVHLVQGNQATQDINRINLERFLKKQRKELKKRERESAAAAGATAGAAPR
jgi:hypothetical protein